MSTLRKTLIELETRFWQSMIDQDTRAAQSLLTLSREAGARTAQWWCQHRDGHLDVDPLRRRLAMRHAHQDIERPARREHAGRGIDDSLALGGRRAGRAP